MRARHDGGAQLRAAEELRSRLRMPKEAEDVVVLEPIETEERRASMLARLRELSPAGRVALAVAFAYLVVMQLYLAKPSWLPHNGHVGEGLFLAPWLLAGALCMLAAGASAGRRRWAWALLGVGMFSWAGAEVYDLVHSLGSDTPLPTPAIIDAGYLGATAFWFAGIWLLSRGNRGVVTEFRSVVDTLIGVAAIGIVIWTLVVQKGLDNYVESTAAMVTNFAYPLFDFGLLAVLLFGLTVSRIRGDVVRWVLVLGLVGITGADLIYFREFFLNGDAFGLGLAQDMGWGVGSVSIGLAAFWQRWGLPALEEEADPAPVESRLAPPFVFLTVTLGVLVWQSAHQEVRGPTVVGVVAVALLMMLRLHLSFRESRTLLLAAQYQALTDALTGLASRRYFEQRLGEEVARARRGESLTAVILIDVDHFKDINDSFGHDKGDAYLTELARRMRIICRGSDIPCRIGGDEFAIIAPGADVEGATILAERFRKAVAEVADELLEGKVPGTISAGICTMPGEPETMEELLKLADNALYEAKKGRNRTVAHESAVAAA